MRMGGKPFEEFAVGSSTKRAICSILREDKNTSTPKGSYAAWFGANSFFLSLGWG